MKGRRRRRFILYIYMIYDIFLYSPRDGGAGSAERRRDQRRSSITARRGWGSSSQALASQNFHVRPIGVLDVVVLSIQPKASLCDHLRRVADVKHAVRATKQMDVRVVLLRQDDRLKTMPEVLTRVLTEL